MKAKLKSFCLLAMLAIFVLTLNACSANKNDEKFAVGSYVTFGAYPQMSSGVDNKPIEWIVLDYDGQKALLLSRYGIDAQPYDSDSQSMTTWEECSLRAWLNSTFMDKAFNAEEQKAILVTDVDNSKSQGYWNAESGNDTQDKVFLLSFAEANKYLGVPGGDYQSEWNNGNSAWVQENLKNMKSRVAPTAYAIEKGAPTWYGAANTEDGKPTVDWWLRSPANSGYSASESIIDSLGFLDHTYSSDTIFVRPALWVNLKSYNRSQKKRESAAAAQAKQRAAIAGLYAIDSAFVNGEVDEFDPEEQRMAYLILSKDGTVSLEGYNYDPIPEVMNGEWFVNEEKIYAELEYKGSEGDNWSLEGTIHDKTIKLSSAEDDTTFTFKKLDSLNEKKKDASASIVGQYVMWTDYQGYLLTLSEDGTVLLVQGSTSDRSETMHGTWSKKKGRITGEFTDDSGEKHVPFEVNVQDESVELELEGAAIIFETDKGFDQKKKKGAYSSIAGRYIAKTAISEGEEEDIGSDNNPYSLTITGDGSVSLESYGNTMNGKLYKKNERVFVDFGYDNSSSSEEIFEIIKQDKTLRLSGKVVMTFEALVSYKHYQAIVEMVNYDEAVALMEAGEYDEALAIFKTLGGYKDSKKRVKKCQEAVNARDYDVAVALKEAEKFEEALAMFETLDGYKDSEKQIKKCQEAINARDYGVAVLLKDAGKYDEALALFEKLDGYKDSEKQIKKCQEAINAREYDEAVKLKDAGKYEEAIAIFEKLDGYKDSKNQIKKCQDAIIVRDYDANKE